MRVDREALEKKIAATKEAEAKGEETAGESKGVLTERTSYRANTERASLRGTDRGLNTERNSVKALERYSERESKRGVNKSVERSSIRGLERPSLRFVDGSSLRYGRDERRLSKKNIRQRLKKEFSEVEAAPETSQFYTDFTVLAEQLKKEHEAKVMECRIERIQKIKEEVRLDKIKQKEEQAKLIRRRKEYMEAWANNPFNNLTASESIMLKTKAATETRRKPTLYFKINKLAKAVLPSGYVNRTLTLEDNFESMTTSKQHATNKDDHEKVQVKMFGKVRNPTGLPVFADPISVAQEDTVNSYPATASKLYPFQPKDPNTTGSRIFTQTAGKLQTPSGDVNPYHLSQGIVGYSSKGFLTHRNMPTLNSTSASRVKLSTIQLQEIDNEAIMSDVEALEKMRVEQPIFKQKFRHYSQKRLRPCIFGGELRMSSSDFKPSGKSTANIQLEVDPLTTFVRKLPFPVQEFHA